MNSAGNIRRATARLAASMIVLWLTVHGQALAAPAGDSRDQTRSLLDDEVAALVDERLQTVARARGENEEAALAEALGDLAIAYEANDLWERCSESWSAALALRGEEPSWRFHYALCLRQAGALAGATEALIELAAGNPSLPWVQERLAETLMERGAFDEAAAAYAKVIELVPNSPLGHAGLGEARLAQRAYAEATAALERAVALAPDYRSARYMLGLAYRAQGRREDAALELRRGVDAVRRYLPDPLTAELGQATVNLMARRERARSLLATGLIQQSMELLEGIVASGAAELDDRDSLAVAYLRLGRLDEAEALLAETETLAPGHFGTQLNLGSLALRRGNLDLAIEHAQRAVEQAPQIARAHFGLASVLARKKDWQASADHLETARELDPRDPMIVTLRGEALARLGRLAEAVEHYEQALSLNPDFLPALVPLAWLELQAGRLASARALHARAEAVAPGHPGVVTVGRGLQAATATPEEASR